MEIREEIKSHARALSCPVVIGYTESTTIQDELCVLSAMGTAARLDFRFFTGHLNYVSSGGMARVPDDLATMMGAASLGGRMDMTTSRMAVDVPGEQPTTSFDEATAVETVAATASSTAVATQPSAKTGSYSKDGGSLEKYIRRIRAHKGRASCQACHIPYHRQRAPFPMNFMRCNCCRKRYVPEILITNVEPLPELETIGQGYYLEAHICRPKKRKDGESNATIVSDTLPFIEYDIHRQLLYKLRIQGLNAIFGLQVQLTIGESLIIAVASGTATYLSALPAPPPLRITRNLDIIDAEDRQLYEIQRRIMERSEENRTRIEASRAARLELQSTVASASGSFMNTTGLGGGGLATVGNDGGLIQTVIPEHGPFQGSVASLPRRPSWPHKDDDTSTVATPLESSMSSPAGAQRSATALRRPFASGIGAPGYTAGDESDSDSTVASEDGAEASGQQFTSMVVQVDDDADEDLMAVLLDPQYPDVFLMCNTETLPIQAAGAGGTMTKMSELNNLLMPGGSRLRSNQQASTALFNAQMITVVKEVQCVS